MRSIVLHMDRSPRYAEVIARQEPVPIGPISKCAIYYILTPPMTLSIKLKTLDFVI